MLERTEKEEQEGKNKQQENPVTFYNVDESWEHYVSEVSKPQEDNH